MADLKVTKGLRNKAVVAETATVAASGKYIDFTGIDNGRAGLIVTNASTTSEVKFTVVHGDGIQGVENGDVEVTVDKGSTALVCFETGACLITTGTNKGCVQVKATASVTVVPVEIA